jgi:NADP-dependent 3-hydroxy acid dehydrogenase YdfG
MSSTSGVAVVSGASGGIGASLVQELLERGFHVVAIGRDSQSLGRGLPDDRSVSMVEWDQRNAHVPLALRNLEVDVLVHNAGVAPLVTVEETTPASLADIMTVNVASAATLTAALLPALRRSRGHVVFINSSAGLKGVPGWSGYLGSKRALQELADALRAEESEAGVKVTSVFPGAVETRLLRQVRKERRMPHDPGHSVSPESAARLVADVLEHPHDGYVTDLSFTRSG